MKAYVIIDERHSLLAEQKKLLNKKFNEIEIVKISDQDLTLDKLEKIAEDLHIKASEATIKGDNVFKSIYYKGETNNAIVFVSPEPYLLKTLAEKSVFVDFYSNIPNREILYRIYIFHFENEEWQLIWEKKKSLERLEK